MANITSITFENDPLKTITVAGGDDSTGDS